MNNACDPPDPK